MKYQTILIFFFLATPTRGTIIKKEDAVCTFIPINPNKASISQEHYLSLACQAGTNVCLPIKLGTLEHSHYVHVRANEIALDHLHNQTEKHITIIARGFAGREKLPAYLRAVKSGLGFINNNIIHNTCITFEFPDSFSTFGFHQEANPLMRLRHFIPSDIQLTLLGDCRGAVLSLEASIEVPHADCIILISGFLSVDELTRQMAKSYLGSTRMAPIIRSLMASACPKFNPYENRFKKTLKHLTNRKILLCHYKNDHMVSRKNIIDLVNTLKENNEVYLMVIDDPQAQHSRLVHLPYVQACINRFLKLCNRPHSATLADAGENFLIQAKMYARYPERYV